MTDTNIDSLLQDTKNMHNKLITNFTESIIDDFEGGADDSVLYEFCEIVLRERDFRRSLSQKTTILANLLSQSRRAVDELESLNQINNEEVVESTPPPAESAEVDFDF